ncbi:MAG: hypothetical protein Kow00109_10810 [Acidobacteriota bacterium]
MKYARKVPLRWSELGWVVCLGFSLAACAKVGDPLPPPPRSIPQVHRLEAVVEGERKLTFRVWVEAKDPVERVLFYRACRPEEKPARVAIIPLEATISSVSDFWEVEFPEPPAAQSCRYAVRVVAGGVASPLSGELVVGPPRNPPPPVAEPPEVTERAVVFRWRVPESTIRIIGFLLNGRRFQEEPRWEVGDFVFDEPVGLRVQAVATGPPVWQVSLPVEMSVVPRDTFPPETPQHLEAVPVQGGVQLVWEEVTAPDLRGYRVYRRTGGASGEVRLLAEVPLNRYLDRVGPEEAGSVEYWVTAVDTRGNESPPSGSVTMAGDTGREPDKQQEEQR